VQLGTGVESDASGLIYGPGRNQIPLHPRGASRIYNVKAVLRIHQSALWSALAACYVGIGHYTCRAADANEIVEHATVALKLDWEADPLYACIEKDEIQKGDKLTSKTFEVVMIDGSDYRFPLAIDDQPLSPARRKAELIKLKNELKRRSNESLSARRSRIDAWKKRRDENGELLLDFPAALTFQLLGEEMKD
jgi:hypothetical protein